MTRFRRLAPGRFRIVPGVLALLPLLGLPVARPAAAQPRATVREFQQTFTTYPYSDPDPIPVPGRIYPYFRFDGYTDTPIEQPWTVVELENAWLKVRVLPQIGGKIWTAIDKTTGRAFLYDNGVVKFRDIAMRGPWTSGGIEANYGIIGHTPNCATPVDYVTREHPDGSASIVIGVLDLLTRTPWRLEIALPADAAYFTTRSLWQNSSPIEQPYYTWMNVGLPAAGNLQFVYPGTHYIDHDGNAFPWPVRAEDGRDLSFYDRNDFGPYKSYHVIGRATDFFGAYWHELDAGMGRYSTRDDKPGKKIWIWGLSPQGMIWERLLTDTSGQYVEVQSGRLFNQSSEASTQSPFKHRGFAPAVTDTWTEYWFPVKGTGGFVAASDAGALNVTHEPAGRLRLRFSPLQRLAGAVEVFDGDTRVHVEQASFEPLRPWTLELPRDVPDARLRVTIAGGRLTYTANPSASALARPLVMPEGFDWETAFGRHLRGRELLRQREYARAVEALESSLAVDPHYVPALVDLAMLRLRALQATDALALAARALAIDTYDPGANYYYGLAALAVDRMADARDGFEIATQSIEYRSAAWHQLARMAARAGDLARARHYATRAADADALDVDARQLVATLARLAGDAAAAGAARDEALAIDPLNHHARFERFVASGQDGDRRAFVDGIRNELPHETFLEIASWYRAIGRRDEAARVLALAPQTAEVLYWRAFLEAGPGPAGVDLLRRAEAAPLDFALPFRAESAEVFEWAARQSSGWQPRYLLALVHLGLGNRATATTLLEECAGRPGFAPFYALRAEVRAAASPDASLADLERAAALDPNQWRFGRRLIERHLRDGRVEAAVAVAAAYHARFPASYVLGMAHARSLLAAGRAREAAPVLASLHVLPYEGATEGRALHRVTELTLAAETGRAGRVEDALRHVRAAREWPGHLGAGKPYPADVDESLEDAMQWKLLAGTRRAKDAAAALERVAAGAGRSTGAGALASALALRDAGRAADATRVIARWEAAESDAAVRSWGRALFDGRAVARPAGNGTLLDPLARLWAAGGV